MTSKTTLDRMGKLRHQLVKEAEKTKNKKRRNKLIDLAGDIDKVQIEYANLPEGISDMEKGR